MKSAEHLTRPQQYTMVYRRGGSWVSKKLVLRAMPNSLDISRYGFSVSKRVGKAVTRNRIKRQLREIMRASALEPARDIVFIVRPAAAGLEYAELKREAEGLLGRAGLIKATGTAVRELPLNDIEKAGGDRPPEEERRR